MNEPMTEADFLPANVLQLKDEARQAKKAAKRGLNPQKVLVRGGQRVVAVKVKIPMDQYLKMQRFEGESDSERFNMLLRMANRRVDDVEKKLLEEKAVAEMTPSAG